MQYFTSGLYGDLKRYMAIKEKLLRRESDHLWIVGDVLDGNTERPWEGLQIIDDIYQSKNVTLLVGDHEYYHALYLMGVLAEESEEELEFTAEALDNLEISGTALREYITSSLSKQELESYATILKDLEVSALVNVGNSYLYLCHGVPSSVRPDSGHQGLSEWQSGVVMGELDLEANLGRNVPFDPKASEWVKEFGSPECFRNPIVVNGGEFVASVSARGEPLIDGVYFGNRKFVINEGFSADDKEKGPFSILGMDAAGWGVKKIRL